MSLHAVEVKILVLELCDVEDLEGPISFLKSDPKDPSLVVWESEQWLRSDVVVLMEDQTLHIVLLVYFHVRHLTRHPLQPALRAAVQCKASCLFRRPPSGLSHVAKICL